MKENNNDIDNKEIEVLIEESDLVMHSNPLLEDTEEIKINNNTLDAVEEQKDTVISNAIEIGKSLVSFGNNKDLNVLDAIEKLHNVVSSIKKDEYLNEEESFLFFKTMQNLSFDHVDKEFVVKNGVIITTSILKLIPIFDTIEEGTLVLTLPYFRTNSSSKIYHQPETISKVGSFWRSHKDIKKELKGSELINFKINPETSL